MKPTLCTVARVAIHCIGALSTVHARCRLALVDLCFAALSRITSRTNTPEIVAYWLASPTVLTWMDFVADTTVDLKKNKSFVGWVRFPVESYRRLEKRQPTCGLFSLVLSVYG